MNNLSKNTNKLKNESYDHKGNNQSNYIDTLKSTQLRTTNS